MYPISQLWTEVYLVCIWQVVRRKGLPPPRGTPNLTQRLTRSSRACAVLIVPYLPAGASREAMVFPLCEGVFHSHDMCAEEIFLSVRLPSPRSFLFTSSKPPHDCTVQTYTWADIHPSLRELGTVGFARYDGSPCERQARRSLVAWRGSPAAPGSGVRGRILTRPDA